MGNIVYWGDRASIFSSSAAAISPPTRRSSGCPDPGLWSTTLTCSLPLTTPKSTRRCFARTAFSRQCPKSFPSAQESGAPPEWMDDVEFADRVTDSGVNAAVLRQWRQVGFERIVVEFS